ncbi:MAG: ankyrin repeat domain-containing protein [Byssovorax sp.]
MDIVWPGITRAETLNESASVARTALADAAKSYIWPRMFEILAEHPGLVNYARPGSASLYAPLHQVAHAGAPAAIVQRLIGLGAWRTLQNFRGERPIDVAVRMGHTHLIEALTPVYLHRVPVAELLAIQEHFHRLIQRRVEREVNKNALRLPELTPLLEIETPKMWFPVPGMYGGFSYELSPEIPPARLVVESWSRVVGGSGQRHEITAEGTLLVAEGFV